MAFPPHLPNPPGLQLGGLPLTRSPHMSDAAHVSDNTFDSILATCGVSGKLDANHDASYDDEDYTHTTRSPGQPSKITPTLKEQACLLASEGCTDREICAQLDINIMTLYRAKRDDPIFCEALNTWKNVADEEVEKSLFNRARGFTHRTEKVWQYQGAIVRAEVNEYVAADVGAATLWLKNRQPDKWRDKHDVNVSVSLQDLVGQALDTLALDSPAPIEGEARDVTAPGEGE